MTLEEMRKIADARTKGEWVALSDRIQRKQTEDNQILSCMITDAEASPTNLKFIAMAANNWDYIFELASQCSFALDQLKKEQEVSQKMMAVVEAAQAVIEMEQYYYVERNLPYPTFYTKYFKALQEIGEL